MFKANIFNLKEPIHLGQWCISWTSATWNPNSSSNSTFICFPKDPQGSLLHCQQKCFPHKNQLKWHLQKYQQKCHPEKNQQKWHPQKDQRTVTLIWHLMLSLLFVGKYCSSKTGDFFSNNTFFRDSQRQNIKFNSRNLSSLGYKGRYLFLKVLRQLCKFVLAQQELSKKVYWQVSKML